MNPPEAPVREGDILAGKYRVERILGVGGMGVVVAAHHTELDQRVALKFLLPDAATNPSVVARFQREAKAAAKIRSEHVARVMDVGQMDSGLPYIVMEFLEGCDLSDLVLKRGQLPVAAAVDYLLEACEALAEAHAAGFIHRDLKPANLYLARQADGSEIIKVLDFGISKAVIGDEPSKNEGALTRTSDVFGSPMYMSPEQLKSARDVDARADVWALGVILYELISGRSPFERNTVAETFGAILYERPVPLAKLVPEVPEGIAAVTVRAMEKDAAARFGNVGEFVKAIAPFGSPGAQASVERTSRVLRRAGVVVESMFPPAGRESIPFSLTPAMSTSTPAAVARAGAATKTSWTPADRAAKPASGGRAAVFVGLALGLVGGAVVVFTQLKPKAPTPTAATERVAATAPPAASPKPVVSAAPPPSATASAAAAPSASAEASVAVAPPPAPSASAVAKHAPKGRLPYELPAPSPVAAPAPPPVTAAPPPPPPVAPKPAEDPDGFGDRK